ncbi:MAG: hypothetical protein PHH77_08410 [Victivallaceae bacterium]|nr:hypothetical protein [Victivallaceae bacterium]
MALGLAVLAGCGKKPVPPPPSAHLLLVQNLFAALNAQQHDTACKRVQKLRALAPANEFLIQLEEREFCNYQIQQAQKRLDAGDIAQTLEIIGRARKKYSLNHNLLAVQTEIKQLSELQEHIKLLNSVASSKAMEAQINSIARFIRSCPAAQVLSPLLRKKMVQAFKRKLYEQECARFDLLCDLATARRAKKPDPGLIDTLLAVLTVANAATVNKAERINPDLFD